MRAYIPVEDDLQGKRNPPDTYARTYECGKSCERMQPVSTCCRNPSSFYSYSIAETRFSLDSALTYHPGHTKSATCTTIINSHSKVSDVILLSPTSSNSVISVFHKLVVYQKRSLRTQVHSLNQHFAKSCSDRSIIQLRRYLAVFGQSAPAAEFRGQDLRIASLTPEQPVIPDVVQRREREDQDIISHVPPGLDGISHDSRSISRQRWTGD
ncbi:hypothetical protein ACTXT7_017469 [Hymenolepis weldensis]